MTTPAKRSGATIQGVVVLVVLGFIVWWFVLRGSGSHPWSLDAGDGFRYPGSAVVGGDIDVTMTVRNSGTGMNPETKLQISDIDHNADLARCEPACSISTVGGLFATFPGIPAGASASYTIHLLAKAVGAPHWTLCLYPSGGEQTYCGSATTTIR